VEVLAVSFEGENVFPLNRTNYDIAGLLVVAFQSLFLQVNYIYLNISEAIASMTVMIKSIYTFLF